MKYSCQATIKEKKEKDMYDGKFEKVTKYFIFLEQMYKFHQTLHS